MHRTFVYKLRLTPTQASACEETLETCRRLYCQALAERKMAWKQQQRFVSFLEQSAALPQLKVTSDYLPLVHSQVLQDVQHRVERAFRAFFRRVKAGERPGYPRFKGRGWYDSFTYPQWGSAAKLRDGRLVLAKIGSLRLCADRRLLGQPKTCALVRKADGWYAHIVCQVVPTPLPPTGESIGIDLGLEAFATFSTGERIANPRCMRRVDRALKSAQRRLSRRKKGSRRRQKARVLLAKAHLKVQRARLDSAHKLAHDLVQRFDKFAVEKLNIRGMLKSHTLARSIADAGWGQFLTILRAQAESAGRVVVEVNPAGTSQICSGCGKRAPVQLSVRWHSCPACGLELHRDENAARNIHKRGGGTAFGEVGALAPT